LQLCNVIIDNLPAERVFDSQFTYSKVFTPKTPYIIIKIASPPF